jgi:hypothetical protein
VARFGSSAADEKPPVGALDRVRALNTVVLPDEGRPIITSLVVNACTFCGNFLGPSLPGPPNYQSTDDLTANQHA